MTHSILITGCSSGIGYAAAVALKKRGYRVFATARKISDVELLVSQGFESVLLDVDDTTSIENALATILEKTGGTLDALFNNAGYLQAGAIEDLTRETNRKQFETNVFGVMELTRLVLPVMRKQGHGRIIQNSSVLGIVTLPLNGAYNASKFALEGFSATLRQELRGTNIFVSLINPSATLTNLRANAYQYFENSIKQNNETVHHDEYKKLENDYFHPKKKKSQSCDTVVSALIHALESKHPRAHYYVGMPAKICAILRRILPDSALDWLLSNVR